MAEGEEADSGAGLKKPGGRRRGWSRGEMSSWPGREGSCWDSGLRACEASGEMWGAGEGVPRLPALQRGPRWWRGGCGGGGVVLPPTPAHSPSSAPPGGLVQAAMGSKSPEEGPSQGETQKSEANRQPWASQARRPRRLGGAHSGPSRSPSLCLRTLEVPTAGLAGWLPPSTGPG